MLRKGPFKAFVLTLLLVAPRFAFADLVTIEITGAITGIQGSLSTFFNVGDPWSISFTVDENAPDQNESADNGTYLGIGTFKSGSIEIIATGAHVAIRPPLHIVSLDFLSGFSGTWPAALEPKNIFLQFKGLDPNTAILPDDNLSNWTNLNRNLFETETMFARLNANNDEVFMSPPATFDSITITSVALGRT